MFRSPGRILYVAMRIYGVERVLIDGIAPGGGYRPPAEGPSRTFVFTDIVGAGEAMDGWLGDATRYDGDVGLVQAVVPLDFPVEEADLPYGAWTDQQIPGASLHHCIDDLDIHAFDQEWRGEARIEASSENVEKARAFLMDRWIDWRLERFPSRPAPDDLSDACKFASLFAQRLFGGDLAANEEHQFVVLPGGAILDLCQDAADVAAMRYPYHNDVDILDEPEWQDAMRSIEPRVSDWVERFVPSPAPTPGA